jgi:hypothetical protein
VTKSHLPLIITDNPAARMFCRPPTTFGQSIFKFRFTNESSLFSTNQVAEDTISTTTVFLNFGDCL